MSDATNGMPRFMPALYHKHVLDILKNIRFPMIFLRCKECKKMLILGWIEETCNCKRNGGFYNINADLEQTSDITIFNYNTIDNLDIIGIDSILLNNDNVTYGLAWKIGTSSDGITYINDEKTYLESLITQYERLEKLIPEHGQKSAKKFKKIINIITGKIDELHS